MLGILRPNTYKAPLPTLSQDFYDFRLLEDEAAADLLVKHIWKLIKKARHKLIQMPGCEGGATGVSVALPADFLTRLARDVVRMTEGEPHGIRGCVLRIEYRDGLERVYVGKIKCDPHLPPTTYLSLVISRGHSAPRSKNPVLKILGSISNNNVIFISPGYLLEKQRPKYHRRTS